MAASREAYGTGLKNLAAVNPKVYAVDGDVKNSTFSETLQKAYPDQLIQGYIAEQNLVSVAVGMAAQGLVPFVDTFACFLSRGLRPGAHGRHQPQQHQSVRLALRRFHRRGWPVANGARGSGGRFARFPAPRCFTPATPSRAERLTEEAARRPGICYIRTSRPKTPVLYTADEKFPVPGLKVLRKSANDSVTVIGAGVTLYEALKAYDQLAARKIAIRVIDLYCIKPIDAAALAENVRATGGRVVTVEDHYYEGGLGEAVLTALAEAGVALSAVKRLAVDRVPHSGKPEELLDIFGISAKHIVEAVDAILQAK